MWRGGLKNGKTGPCKVGRWGPRRGSGDGSLCVLPGHREAGGLELFKPLHGLAQGTLMARGPGTSRWPFSVATALVPSPGCPVPITFQSPLQKTPHLSMEPGL